MTPQRSKKPVLEYHGKSWLKVNLPREGLDWSHGGGHSIAADGDDIDTLVAALSHLNDQKKWRWPKRRHFFFSDLHGDAEAFATSLVGSGGVKKTGKKPTDFILTQRGKNAVFVIGGDCFDKGPSVLKLLRTILHLIEVGARVRVLAGNHDVRVLLGMAGVKSGPRSGAGPHQMVEMEHFFIRTGQKIIPLIREIWDEYLKNGDKLKGIPGRKECRKRLYPSDTWSESFSKRAEGLLRPLQVRHEVSRIVKKQDRFEKLCAAQGLTLRHVYAAVQKWQQLFMAPSGEFCWFYKRLRWGYRAGSFLFVHAGLDDTIAKRLRVGGMKKLNDEFRQALHDRPFGFYYGALCNAVRTKYRNVDLPFSTKGARFVRQAGISAVIHGHRNSHHGQRLAGRCSVLNFECDASLDSHTRTRERVRGRGAAVTIIEPGGRIFGVSGDYPYVKVFEPDATLAELKKGRKQLRQKS